MPATIRVYVGTYAKYNGGSIAGGWLDIEDYSDKDEFHDACAELHSDEEDPEFMFQDWEGFPEGMIGESFISDDAFEFAGLDEDEQKMLTLYRSDIDRSGTIEQARESFQGKYREAADYAEELTRECNEIPDFLDPYIDWERMARDMGFGGTSFVRHEGETWVFESI